MNKRDIRRAEMAADLLCPPPEIVYAFRLRDVFNYLWRKRGLREPREIVAAIRRFRWASESCKRAILVRARVEKMVAHESLDDTPPPARTRPPRPRQVRARRAQARRP